MPGDTYNIQHNLFVLAQELFGLGYTRNSGQCLRGWQLARIRPIGNAPISGGEAPETSAARGRHMHEKLPHRHPVTARGRFPGKRVVVEEIQQSLRRRICRVEFHIRQFGPVHVTSPSYLL
jgi:hypothetical protein